MVQISDNKLQTTEENVLMLDDLYGQGYGILPKKVMRARDLSVGAKAFYAYLCSFAGAGNTAFPSTDTIRAEMGWSKNAFYKYRSELETFGLIVLEVTQTRYGKRTTYHLPSTPVPKKDAEDIIEKRREATKNKVNNLPKPILENPCEVPSPQNEDNPTLTGR